MTIRVYQVGGSVRDLFLEKKPKDIDYAVEAPSYLDMKNYLIATGAEIFLETPQYVTIRALWAPLSSSGKMMPCDFTLCRKESDYDDFRHPSKIEPGTILEDLSRRDATINSIAINVITGEIIDPNNGVNDLKNKILRCVGNPSDRFLEDPLRILRFLRLSVTLNFSIEIETEFYMKKYFSLIEKISVERIREELYKMFKFNTNKSLELIMNYPYNILFLKNMWLMPTLKS